MRAGRCSAKAVPATAWPGLSPPVVRPVRHDRHRVAGRVRPAQGVDLRVVQVDPRAVRFEQAGGLLDDPLEDLGGLEDGRHAGRDLAQGPLASACRATSARDRSSSSIRRALVIAMAAWSASAPTRPASVSLNAARCLRVDLDDAERTRLAGDRAPRSSSGSRSARRTRSIRVTCGNCAARSSSATIDPALGHGDARRADPDRDPQGGPLLLAEQAGQAVVHRPVQVAGRRVEQVEDDPVAPGPGARPG